MARWLVALVVVGGCAEERPSPPAVVAPVVVPRDAAPPSVDAAPGLPLECQRYRMRVVRVAACPQLAPLDRDQVMRAFFALENRWAAMPPAELGTLAGTCQAASEAVVAIAGPCDAPAEAPPAP